MDWILWADLYNDLQVLLQKKLDPNAPRGLFFGLRAHPIHEVCPDCKKVVDYEYNRMCPTCGVTSKDRHPWIQYHNGQDLPKAARTPIHAPWSGVVTKSWFDPKVKHGGHGGGNSVIIAHHEGPVQSSGYCHLYALSPLKPKSVVEAGDIIGEVGSTGDSTGPHLHLTLRKTLGGKQVYVDPLPELLAAVTMAEIPWHLIG